MKPAVVLIHGQDPTCRLGGGERYVCAQARAAVRAGFEVHLFCVSAQAGVEEVDLGTIHRVWSPVRPFRSLMACWHSPFLTRGLQRFLARRRGPHILHAFTSWAAAAVNAAAFPVRPDIRCAAVVSVWDGLYEEAVAKLAGVDPSQGLRGRINPAIEVAWNALVTRRYEGRNYRRCQAVYVNYESIRRLLVSRYDVDPARVHRLPYASETAFLPLAGRPIPDTISELRSPGAPLIVVISRHVPRKGLTVLLRALADLLARKCAFRACFVGGGYLLEHHRRLVNELGLSHVVRLVGRVPESFDYVRPADLFVLPSLEEGSGSMSMIEAMQASVAVIATRIDGIPEDVTDNESALLVEPGNIRELADAIARLLEDPALRRRVGARGHQTFLERFSADVMTQGVAEAYGRVDFTG